MSGSGRESLSDVWERSGVPLKCPGVVGRPSWMSGMPSRMSESGWEAHSEFREWSGVHPGFAEVVRRPSRMSGSAKESLPDDRES